MVFMRVADLESIFQSGGDDAKRGSAGKRQEDRGHGPVCGICRKYLISIEKKQGTA
jgi:hypothetical protein